MKSAFRGVRASILLACSIAACLALLLVPGTAAAHAKCDTVDGTRYCASESSHYPKLKGWYGWISTGNRCGPTVLPNWYGDDGMVGVCGGGHDFWNERVYRYVDGAWQEAWVPKGTTAYVHPFNADWRWVYTQQTGWAAIRASNLLLKWRA